MSIADKLMRLAAAKEAIISAITEMGGTVDPDAGFESLALATKEIPSGDEVKEPPIEQLCVEFFDWDTQKLLYVKYPSDFPLSEMPPLPKTTRTDIVPYAWNYTLEDLNHAAANGFYPCVICLYDTVDHLTHITIDVPYDNFTVTHYYKAKNRIIDWGDGTVEDLSDNNIATQTVAGCVSIDHTYTTAGRYNIKISGSINGAYSGQVHILEPTSIIYGIYLGSDYINNNHTHTGYYLSISCQELTFPENWRGAKTAINMSATLYDGYNNTLGGSLSKIKRISYNENMSSIAWNTVHSTYSTNSVNLQIRQLPSGIKDMRDIYQNCLSLTYIQLPSTLTTMNGTFQNCYNLKTVNFPSGLQNIGANTFVNCYSLRLSSLPDTITTLGNSAFGNCYRITLSTLPTNLTSIGNSAFYGCTLLNFSSLPSSLTTLGTSAFENCSYITISSLPTGVTVLNNNAFKNCTSITNFTIHEDVTTIGAQVFNSCASLTQVNIMKSTPPTLSNTNAFPTNNSGFKIVVPNGSLEAYSTATNWSLLYNNRYLEEAPANV